MNFKSLQFIALKVDYFVLILELIYIVRNDADKINETINMSKIDIKLINIFFFP